MKKLTLIAAALALSTTFISPVAMAEQKFVTIGTGGVTGVYYAAGGAIARRVDERSRARRRAVPAVAERGEGHAPQPARAVQLGHLAAAEADA